MPDRLSAYADWIVANEDKKGTEEFETVANTYKQLRDQGVSASATEPDYAGERTFLGQTAEFVKAIPRGFGRGVLSVGEGVAELADAATNFIGLDELIDSGDDNALVAAARQGQKAINNSFLGAGEAYQDAWTTKFGEGLGSLATFLTPGAALRLAGYAGKAGKLATAVGSGSNLELGLTGTLAYGTGAAEAAQRAERAREEGIDVTEGQEDAAVLGGAFIGLSELAPLGGFLRKLNPRKMNDKIRTDIMSKLGSALKNGGYEALQETGAGLAQDLLARGIYDPDADFGEGWIDNFTVGGAAGATADLVLTAMSGRRGQIHTATEQQNELEKRKNAAEEVAKQRESYNRRPEEDIDPSTIPPESDDMVAYAGKIARTLGPQFPGGTSFSIEETTIELTPDELAAQPVITDPQSPRVGQPQATTKPAFRVRDSEGVTYGMPLSTQGEAAVVAGTLQSEIVNQAVRNGVTTTIETSQETYDEPTTDTLGIYGVNIVNPRFNEVSTNAVNMAAGTTVDKGFDEQLSAQQAMDKQTGRVTNEAQMVDSLTAAQRINRKRLSQGLPESDTFSIEEAREVLGKDFGKLGEVGASATLETESYEATTTKRGRPIVVSSAGEVIDTYQVKRRRKKDGTLSVQKRRVKTPEQAAALAERLNSRRDSAVDQVVFEDMEIGKDRIKTLLERKGISNELDSPAIKTMAKAFVGKESIDEMDSGEMKYLYQKIRRLPVLHTKQGLPDFKIRPYTQEQFAGAQAYINETGETRIGPIAEAAGISAADPRHVQKVEAIVEDLRKTGRMPQEAAATDEAPLKLPTARVPTHMPGVEYDATELRADLEGLIRKELDRIGLKKTQGTVLQALYKVTRDSDGRLVFKGKEPVDAEGAYSKGLNEIFLGIEQLQSLREKGATPDEMWAEMKDILNHETLHAMRELDLFTAKEWALLERLASTTKVPGTNETYFEQAKRRYAKDNLGRVGEMEEAIAELVRGGRRLGGKPRTLINRIRSFFESMMNFLSGSGFQNFDTMIAAIESGEIGGREAGEVRTLKKTRAERDRLQSEALEGVPKGAAVSLEDFENLEEVQKFVNEAETVLSKAGIESNVSRIVGLMKKDKLTGINYLPKVNQKKAEAAVMDFYNSMPDAKKKRLEEAFATVDSAKFAQREALTHAEVTVKIPEVGIATILYKDGLITRAQRNKVVDRFKPVTPYKELTDEHLTTESHAKAALSSDKVPKFQKSREAIARENLEYISLRLDIPAYRDKGAWVVALHRLSPNQIREEREPVTQRAGSSLGYELAFSINNVSFGTAPAPTTPKTKAKEWEQLDKGVATSADTKNTFAVINGKPELQATDESLLEEARQILKDMNAGRATDWVQVGYDPERHAYYYNRETGQPVVTAERVIQVGPLVLAQNPNTDSQGAPIVAKQEDFAYSRRDPDMMSSEELRELPDEEIDAYARSIGKDPLRYRRGVLKGERKMMAESQIESRGRRRFLKRMVIGAMGGAATIAQVERSARAGEAVSLGRARPVSKDILKSPLTNSQKSVLQQAMLQTKNEGDPEGNLGAAALREVLEDIAISGPRELRALAADMARLMPTTGVRLDFKPRHSGRLGEVSFNVPAVMTLYGERSLNLGTVLHESLHANVITRFRSINVAAAPGNADMLGSLITNESLAALDQFRRVWDEFETASEAEWQRMDALYNGAGLAPAEVPLYNAFREARNKPDEFFVRTLTDPALQEWMSEQVYEGKTLMDRFIDWIRDTLFGSPSGIQASWLDAALVASQDYIITFTDQPPNFAVIQRIEAGRAQAGEATAPLPEAEPTTTPEPRAIPQTDIDEAVALNLEAIESAPGGAVMPYSAKASPTAQAVARNPDLAAQPTSEQDFVYSRNNEPDRSTEDQEFIDSLITDPDEKPNAIEIFSEAKADNFDEWKLKFRQAYINRHAPVEKMSLNIRNTFKVLADSDAHAALMMADRAKAIASAAMKYGIPVYENGTFMVKDFMYKGNKVMGLIEVMAPLMGANVFKTNLEKDAQSYAIAMRAKAINDSGRKSPIEKGKEQEAIDRAVKNANNYINPDSGVSYIVEWYNQYQAYNNHLIDFMESTGIISADQRATWQDMASYYPFYREANGEAKEIAVEHHLNPVDIFGDVSSIPKTETIKASDLKKLVGSGRKIDVPLLEAVVRNFSSGIELGMRNVAHQRVMRDALYFGFATDITDTKKPTPKPNMPTFIFNIRVKGQKKQFQISDPLLFQALEMVPDTSLHNLINTVTGIPARALRELVTRDPGFMVVNVMRDTLSAYVTSGATFKPGWDTLKNLAGDITELEKLGVVGGYDFVHDPKDMAKFVKRESRQRGIDTGETGVRDALDKSVGRAWRWLGAGTTRSDYLTRKNVFDDTLARTDNLAEAQMQAMEVINFGRRGGNANFRLILTAIPFLNARIQGLDVFYRAGISGTYSANSELGKAQIRKNFALRGMTLLGLTALYWLMASDTEEYKEADDYVRDNNWLLPNPFSKSPIKFPIPFEVGLLFKTIPEKILDTMFKDSTATELGQTIGRGLGTTFELNPFSGVQLTAPIFEAAVNHNFYTGRPIVPYYTDQGVEDAFQRRYTTNEFANMIGQWTNLSPMKIEHVLKGYAGTIGIYGLDLIDHLLRSEAVVGDESKKMPQATISTAPILKRFFASPEGRGLQEDFYRMNDEVKMIANTVANLEDEGRIEELQRYLVGRQHILALEGDFRSIATNLSEMRKEREEVLRSDIEPSLKREQLDLMDEEMNNALHMVPFLKEAVKLPLFKVGRTYRD